MSELPKLEIYFYFFVWTSGVCISLYRLFAVGQVFDHELHDKYHYDDFAKGWSILGNRYRDRADFEWNTWTALFITLSPFLLVNFISAEFMRCQKNAIAVPIFYAIITVSFLLFHFNILLTFWFICQALVYLVAVFFKSHILIWVLSFIIIYFLKPDMWLTKNDDEQYLIMVSSAWMVLRCISYSTEKINKSDSNLGTQKFKLNDVTALLGYSLYLPTMFCGPFISYHHFHENLICESVPWTERRICGVLKNFARCIFWYFFTVLALHYIYVNAILLRPELVKHLLDWELAGLGIAMGHFFHLKYIVFYGLPCAWASAEGLTTPELPCCVSTVHLYSYMWRHFDQGLYQFLVRYIYVPVQSLTVGSSMTKKFLASVGCFAFMFMWHNSQDYVFFWVLFNFLAITMEMVAKEIFARPKVRTFLARNVSARNQLRLQCVLAAPLHCFSMISNYFFIGNGMEIGLVYLNRIIYGSNLSKLIIWFFLYGAGQSAVATQKWKHRK